MGDVIDFGTHRQKNSSKTKQSSTLAYRLEGLQEVLGEIYGHIEDAYENLKIMEVECSRVEAFYDETLLEFAKDVGPGNVPSEFLDYSTSVTAVKDEMGIITLKLEEIDPAIEIIFTPESEE